MTNATSSHEQITTPSEPEHGPAMTPPVGRWGVLLRAGIALALTLVAYGPMLLVTRFIPMDARADALAGDWWLALAKQAGPILLIPLTAVLLIAVCTRWLDRRPFSVTGIRFDRRTVPALLLGTAISVAIMVPAILLTAQLGLVEQRELTQGSQPLWVAVAFTLVLGYGMQGITEEVVWRGWFTQSVGGSYQRQALIAAVGFGLIHIMSNGGHASFWVALVYMINAGAFGYAAAALYFATGSIWAAVGIHGGLHLGTFIAMELGAVGGNATELITLVLYLLVGLVVMRRLPNASR